MPKPELELVGRAFPLACPFRSSDETVDAYFRRAPATPQSFMDTVRMSNRPLLAGEAGRAADNEGVVGKNIAFVPAGGREGVFGRFSGVARRKTGSRAVGLSSYSGILVSRRDGRLFLCKRCTPRGGEPGGKKSA